MQIQQRIIETAREWEKNCAIRFVFGTFPDPDITISLNNEGFWSNIGSDSKGKRPSMSLTGLSSSMSQDDYNSLVLHEFRHAMGFVHEHQVPDFNIPWKVDRLERYYKLNMDGHNRWYMIILLSYMNSHKSGEANRECKLNCVKVFFAPLQADLPHRSACFTQLQVHTWTAQISSFLPTAPNYKIQLVLSTHRPN